MELNPSESLILTPRQRQATESLLARTATARANAAATTWDWADIGVSGDEARVIEWLRRLRPARVGVRTPAVTNTRPIRALQRHWPDSDSSLGAFLGQFPTCDAIELHGQRYRKDGVERLVKPPVILTTALLACIRLQSAIRGDLGSDLIITSQFRSPAYQALLFLDHLCASEFDASLAAKTVALPGYSQHADMTAPAFDFGTADGLMFEHFHESTEYRWLLERAHTFGFVNPYLPGNRFGIASEPWHWQLVPDGHRSS